MEYSVTRRKLLAALTAGSTVAIAGCGSDDPTADDDTEQPGVDHTDGEEATEDETEAPEPDELLFIASGEEYTLEESEQYDGIEIEPTGTILLEPNSSLELSDFMNT